MGLPGSSSDGPGLVPSVRVKLFSPAAARLTQACGEWQHGAVGVGRVGRRSFERHGLRATTQDQKPPWSLAT